ncbi:hypothetical protein [Ekhidna sp.]|uniref:hypothetical protein n=1 Tax=Ekhidna sp. TaxID=2608089 RepID=UPI003B50C534
MRKLFSIIGLFVSCLLAAQEEEWRVIPSVREWLEEINNWPDSVYRQDNLHVFFDYEKDTGLIATTFEETDSLPSEPLFIVNKPVRVSGLNFAGDRKGPGTMPRRLTSIQFNGWLTISRMAQNRAGFVGCVFKDDMSMWDIQSRNVLQFVDCDFEKSLHLYGPQENMGFYIANTSIKEDLIITSGNTDAGIRILNSDLSQFFVNGKFTQFRMDSTNVRYGMRLSNVTISNSFQLQNTSLPALELIGTDFPELHTYIPFHNIENALALDLPIGWDRDQDLVKYKAESKEEIMDTQRFDNLIASYYTLLEVYKSRGELTSYNACYIEMRDKVTARSKLLYNQDPSFTNFFAYQINRFTRAFSDYGTRPEKAIIVFFQVVLAFSIFYFFFPSSWNTTNNRTMMRRLSYLGSYFTSKEGLSDLFEKEAKEDYKDYEEFHQFISSSEKRLPIYFQWLSKPLYRVSVSRFNLSRRLLASGDILKGEWDQLPKAKQVRTSILIGLYLVIYLIYVLIIRCLNAITLSLNAFSTLGFGEIPTRGLARYVTIIQGFVGWFLLSIFLVSLIGQILN